MIAAWAFLLLHIFERPIWTYSASASLNWNNEDVYPSFGICVVPFEVSIPLSCCLLAALAFAAYLDWHYEDDSIRGISRHFSESRLLMILVSLKMVQNIVNLSVLLSLSDDNRKYISFSPVEAFILLIIENRYMANIEYFSHTLPLFGLLTLVLGASVCMYTGMGFLLFENGSDERTVIYPSFGQGLWNMLMVLSGSNWPGPAIPAYNSSRLSIIYFFVYLIVFNWGLLNFVLGYICSMYRSEHRTLSQRFERTKNVNLRKAFLTLGGGRETGVSLVAVDNVLRVINFDYDISFYPANPVERRALVQELDLDNTGEVNFRQFMQFYDQCGEESLHAYRRYIMIEMSSRDLRRSMDSILPMRIWARDLCSWSFRRKVRFCAAVWMRPELHLIVDLVMFSLGVAFLATYKQIISIVMLLIQGLDSSIKIAALGSIQEYLHGLKARFDMLYSATLLIFLIIEMVAPTDASIEQVFISTITLIRIAALPFSFIMLDECKIHREKLWTAYSFAMRGSKSFSFLLLLLFVSIYVVADFGLHIFGGAICLNCKNSDAIANSSYGVLGYYPVNFNDMLSALVTLFLLLQVNNTHVISSGFCAAMNSYLPELFFGLWYIIGVLLLLNVLTAFFLTGFLQYLKSVSDRGINNVVESNASPINQVINSNELKQPNAVMNEHEQQLAMASASCSQGFNLSSTPLEGASTSFKSPSPTPSLRKSRFAVSVIHNLSRESSPERIRGSMTRTRSGTVWQHPTEDPNVDSDDEHDVVTVLHRQYKSQTYIRPKTFRVNSVNSTSSAGPDNESQLEGTIGWIASRMRQFSVSLFHHDEQSHTKSTLADRVRIGYSDLKATLLPKGQHIDSRQSSPLRSYQSFNTNNNDSVVASLSSSRHVILPTSDKVEERLEAIDFRSIYPVTEDIHRKEQEQHLLDMDTRFSDDEEDDEASNSEGEGKTSNFKSSRRSLWDEASLNWLWNEEEMLPHESAAALVQIAREGVQHGMFKSRRALDCFRLRHKLSFWLQAVCWLNLFLSVFQQPKWTYTTADWHSGTYPMWGVPYLPPDYFIAIYVPLLLFLLLGLLLEHFYQEEQGYTFNWINIARATLTSYCVIQIMVLCVIAGTENRTSIVGYFSFTSAAYLFWFDHHSRWKFELVLGLIPRLIMAFVAYALVVVMFAALGPVIFQVSTSHDDDDYKQHYFRTFSDACWSVFISITTSSFPNQIMPLYTKYRAFALYFVFFMSLGAFGAVNLVLVFVFWEYRTGLQNKTASNRRIRDEYLLRAFNQMDTIGRKWLDYDQVGLLLDELFAHYGDFRKGGIPSKRKRTLLTKILDIDGDGKVSAEDFAFLIDVTRIKIKQSSDKTFMQLWLPSIAYSNAFLFVSSVFNWWAFDALLDTLASALIIGRLSVAPGAFDYTHDAFQINCALWTLLLFELLGRLAVDGYRGYMIVESRKVNAALTIFYTAAMIVSCRSMFCTGYNSRPAQVVQLVVQVIRLACFPRNFWRFAWNPRRVYLAMQLFRRILRRMYTLGIVFICIMGIFALSGMAAFGGLVNTDPNSYSYEVLESSAYAADGYWALNFNDLPSSLVTLFCCLHVSDFDVITEAFNLLAGWPARLFFAVWYTCGVLLLLNMVKSFFLSEFLPTMVAALTPSKSAASSLPVSGIASIRQNDESEPPSRVETPFDLNCNHFEETNDSEPNAASPLPAQLETLPPEKTQSTVSLESAAQSARENESADSYNQGCSNTRSESPMVTVGGAPLSLLEVQEAELSQRDSFAFTNMTDQLNIENEENSSIFEIQSFTLYTPKIPNTPPPHSPFIASQSPVIPALGQMILSGLSRAPSRRVSKIVPSDSMVISSLAHSPQRVRSFKDNSDVNLLLSSDELNECDDLEQKVTPAHNCEVSRYEASTEFVKDLDQHDLKLLHERLKKLAAESDMAMLPAVEEEDNEYDDGLNEEDKNELQSQLLPTDKISDDSATR